MAEIAAAQSDFTADRIREGNLEGVIWPYLGKFHIQPKKIQNATQNYNFIKKKATQFPKAIQKNERADQTTETGPR